MFIAFFYQKQAAKIVRHRTTVSACGHKKSRVWNLLGLKFVSLANTSLTTAMEKATGRLREKGLPGLFDLKKIWYPTWFQGNRRHNQYFEGWYIKLVSADLSQAWAFIPGVSLHHEDAHSFVQVIDGMTGQTWYYRFPEDAFRFSKTAFQVQIDDNHFSTSGIQLSLHDSTGTFKGQVNFNQLTPYKASLARPGIMGWYRYMPFMECYHGVVSMDHEISGTLSMLDRHVDFSGGRGYMEKDWGTSMPKAWVWMQTNHFSTEGDSFMLSVADIPWIGKTFPGFLGFIYLAGKQHVFATYTGARITKLNKENNGVWIQIEDNKMKLEIRGEKTGNTLGKGALKAPLSGQMSRIIHESMNATIHIRLTDRQDNLLFEDTGQRAGLEMVGDTSLLNTR